MTLNSTTALDDSTALVFRCHLLDTLGDQFFKIRRCDAFVGWLRLKIGSIGAVHMLRKFDYVSESLSVFVETYTSSNSEKYFK